ncbi:nicotinate (nicotinamide) nucleotide adenylyltransferase [Rhodoferax aquaticus]|uniref:Probable nicotinate-nucleotide adenylyltransferase n=1 Tax=Rhodoferax aquaticus TaxID=2527691 RepID=A0A515ENN9_9BURK|nr:nicotinate (nicotinamide) nucleotide adenylyltransferase [Rhodoferax aquaticus]QDL54287.1 nicotinate (nicotinamide) nucleotide adenylyltransferase [Rhodoferax aquaticus]
MSASIAPVMRVGLYGGAFDPPHRGHVALAQAAVSGLHLDVLHVVPTGQAWHKTRDLSDAKHRLAMARLAFEGVAGVVVDPREIERHGPSYTLVTLDELKRRYPEAQLFLILGQDQAQAFASWWRADQISQLAIICVAARAGFMGETPLIDSIQEPNGPFQPLEMPLVPVSATEIRHAVAARQNVAPLVFEPVARYIDQHHLYQTAR